MFINYGKFWNNNTLFLLKVSVNDCLSWFCPGDFLRMLFAAAVSFGTTIVLGRKFIDLLNFYRVGHCNRTLCVNQLNSVYHKRQSIPSMGGALIIVTTCWSSLIWMRCNCSISWILLIAFILSGTIGIIDDWTKHREGSFLGISRKIKALLQLILALSICIYLFQFWPGQKSMKLLFVPFVRDPLIFLRFGWIWSFLLALFVIVGSSNAVNLSDGLDGLACGLSVLVSLTLGVAAFLTHCTIDGSMLLLKEYREIGIFLFALMGSLLGFLWFNKYPADVFMGDTGSLSLGFVLGLSSVLLRREFLFGVISGVFVLETLSVIVQILYFRWKGKRIFLCAPLHHHFQLMGWSEIHVVMRFWLMGIIFSMIGFFSLYISLL